jgi:hypothetical protein
MPPFKRSRITIKGAKPWSRAARPPSVPQQSGVRQDKWQPAARQIVLPDEAPSVAQPQERRLAARPHLGTAGMQDQIPGRLQTGAPPQRSRQQSGLARPPAGAQRFRRKPVRPSELEGNRANRSGRRRFRPSALHAPHSLKPLANPNQPIGTRAFMARQDRREIGSSLLLAMFRRAVTLG